MIPHQVAILLLVTVITILAQDSAPKEIFYDSVVTTVQRKPVLHKNSPEIISILPSREIEKTKPSSTSEALSLVPGVSIETGTMAGMPYRNSVSINGVPVQYSLIMVDGVRLLSEHIHTGVNVNLVPVGNVERLEVLQGAGSAQYGSDAMGGVLNIITRVPSGEPSLSFKTYGGSRSTYGGELSMSGAAGKSIRHRLYNSWEQSEGVRITDPASRANTNGYRRLDIMDRVRARFSESVHGDFSVQYNRSATQFQDTRTGVISDNDSWLFTPKAALDWRLSENWELRPLAYATQWKNQKNGESNALGDGQLSASFAGIRNHGLLAGVEAAHHRFTRKGVAVHTRDAYAVFAGDDCKFGERWTASLAARADQSGDLDAAFSPKLSARFQALKNLALRASAGRGYRAPSLQDLYEVNYQKSTYLRSGNPALKPEFSTNIAGSAEWAPLKQVVLSATAFRNDFTDMIVLEDVGDSTVGSGATVKRYNLYHQRNIEEAVTQGVDGVALVALPFRLEARLGLSYITDKNKTTGGRLPYSPGYSVSGRLSGAWPVASGLGVKASVHSKSCFSRAVFNVADNRDQYLADYHKLDGTLSLEWKGRQELYFTAENLLQEEIEYHDDAYMKLAGHSMVRIGMALSF